ncbi:MAG: uracil phosphoribosyltransferase [Oscillospiraceae bacterium]|nr:uracil phosphoribosyltransferase [Oscillospiraceae bacterium]
MGKVYVFDHPLIQHKLSIMRNKETSTKEFRELLSEIAMLMTYEITRDLPTDPVEIETPIGHATVPMLKKQPICLVPILRAGLGMVDAILKLLPNAKVGHIGMYRDEETLKPVPYYCKLPNEAPNSSILILEPMNATGGSTAAGITVLKERGCKNIKVLNLIATPQGAARVHEEHPDVDIYIASMDEGLNENAYIVPGLGDAGDRIFGTK